MARPRVYGAVFAKRVIDHAAHLLTDEGPDALTVRRLADDMGASTGAIYRTVGTKDELLRGMFLEGFARMETELCKVPHDLSPVQRLRQLGFAYQRAALRSPHLYTIMFERPVPEFHPDDDDRAYAQAGLQILIRAVERAIEADEIRPDAGCPHDIAVRMWAINHGITALVISGMLNGDPGEHLEHTMDLLFQALSPE